MDFKEYLNEAMPELDLKTQVDDFNRLKYEIANKIKLLPEPIKTQFNNELSSVSNEYAAMPINALDPEKIHNLKAHLRIIYKQVDNASRPQPVINPVAKRAINTNQTMADYEKSVEPKEAKPKGIEALAARIKKEFQKDAQKDNVVNPVSEPAINQTSEPRMPVSDIGKMTPAPINLKSLENFLDSNKDSIDLDMYQMAKNAIQKANSTNDPEDIKIAKDMVSKALENA